LASQAQSAAPNSSHAYSGVHEAVERAVGGWSRKVAERYERVNACLMDREELLPNLDSGLPDPSVEPRELQSAVFDLDGVLIDSEPLMRFAFARSYETVVGRGSAPIESYLEHMGEAFPRIMDRLRLPQSLWEPYRAICRSRLDLIRLFPGSHGLLEFCSNAGIRMAILTGKDQERTEEILEYFGLLRFFEVVAGSDQLTHSKPHPEGILFALGRLGCQPHDAVMIGDSVNDILCAQRAGVFAIGVTWGTKPERLRRLCAPNRLVDNFDNLRALLRRLAGRPVA